jgi:hypothetical protein
MHPEHPRLVRSRRHDTTLARVAPDYHRLADERRVPSLLHRNEEGIQVNVKDLPRHRVSFLARSFYLVKSTAAQVDGAMWCYQQA